MVSMMKSSKNGLAMRLPQNKEAEKKANRSEQQFGNLKNAFKFLEIYELLLRDLLFDHRLKRLRKSE